MATDQPAVFDKLALSTWSSVISFILKVSLDAVHALLPSRPWSPSRADQMLEGWTLKPQAADRAAVLRESGAITCMTAHVKPMWNMWLKPKRSSYNSFWVDWYSSFRSSSLCSYLTPHLVPVYEERVPVLINSLVCEPSRSSLHFQLLIIRMWHHRHSCIPLLRFPLHFNSQPQKIRGAHSIPASEKKSAEERATRRQNKQISKHFLYQDIKRPMRWNNMPQPVLIDTLTTSNLW